MTPTLTPSNIGKERNVILKVGKGKGEEREERKRIGYVQYIVL
jgi:hypothetical protein